MHIYILHSTYLICCNCSLMVVLYKGMAHHNIRYDFFGPSKPVFIVFEMRRQRTVPLSNFTKRGDPMCNAHIWGLRLIPLGLKWLCVVR